MRYPENRRFAVLGARPLGIAACLVAMFSLTVGGSALGQDRRSGLELSEEQREQIRELVEQERTDVRESREALRGQIADLLTEEQREEILDDAIRMRFDRRQRADARQPRRDFRARDGRRIRNDRAVVRRAPRAVNTQRMFRALNLSDEQRTQVAAVLKSEREAIAQWREDNAEADQSERVAFMEERKNATRAAIRDLLTEEQQARFDDQETRQERRQSPRRRR